jgi:hypothetical protein
VEVSGGDRKLDEKVNWSPCGGVENTVVFLLVIRDTAITLGMAIV